MDAGGLTAGERRAVRNALDVRRRRRVLEYAKALGNVSEACRELGIPRRTFYRWRKRIEHEGEGGLMNRQPGPKNHPWSTPPEVVEKIIHLRTKYHLGPQRITWYLERYHGIQLSCSTSTMRLGSVR